MIDFITYTATLLIGFAFGYLANKESVEKAYKATRQRLSRREVGTVKRPSAERLRKRGTIEEETEQAMTETLEKIL